MYFIPLEDYQKVQGDPTELAPDEVILFVTDEAATAGTPSQSTEKS